MPGPEVTATAFDYAVACLALTTIVLALGFTSIVVRRRLTPRWSGSPARLAELILGTATGILLLQLLGLAGILSGITFTAASILLATVVGVAVRDPASADAGARAATPSPQTPPWQLWVAIAVTALLFAQWSMPTLAALDRGIYGGDSLWYHMPFAADIARTHSITALHFVDPLYLNWFYPQNSELLHAAGISLFGNDFLSPLINLFWLGLALLSAWVAGRRWGNGGIAVLGVAILLSADLMFSRQPGNANNDIVAIALMLASVALLLSIPGEKLANRRAVAIAGLAAGLALGTKLTVLLPVAILTAGVVFVASGDRRRTAIAWTAPLLAGCGVWFARNLFVAGNPLPWQKLGPLPRSEALQGREEHTVLHYATDSSVWRHYFFPGLDERFGDLWPVVLAIAAIAIVVLAIRGGRLARMLAAAAALMAVAYVVTPLGASGAEGAPLGFRLNLRYLAPALAIGLVLPAALPSLLPEGRRRTAAIGVAAILGAVLLLGHSPLAALDDGYLGGALAIAAGACAVAVFATRSARFEIPAILAAAAIFLLGFLVAGWPLDHEYQRQRYALGAPGYPTVQHPATELADGLGDAYAWANDQRDQRIALGGTTGALFQYGLYGPDGSNRVDYIGSRGPRGSFDEVPDCQIWRAKINDGGYGFVVTTPGYDQDMPEHQIQTRFARWTATDAGSSLVLRRPNVSIFRIDAPLDPARCE